VKQIFGSEAQSCRKRYGNLIALAELNKNITVFFLKGQERIIVSF
jgi:hypothetical protein